MKMFKATSMRLLSSARPHSLPRFASCEGAKKNSGFGPGISTRWRVCSQCVAPILQEYFNASPKWVCTAAMISGLPAMSTTTLGIAASSDATSLYVTTSWYSPTLLTKSTFRSEVRPTTFIIECARKQCARAIDVLLDALVTSTWVAPKKSCS